MGREVRHITRRGRRPRDGAGRRLVHPGRTGEERPGAVPVRDPHPDLRHAPRVDGGAAAPGPTALVLDRDPRGRRRRRARDHRFCVRRGAPRLAGRRRPARRAGDGTCGPVDGGPVAARRVDARPGRRLSTDATGDDRAVGLARRGEDGEPADLARDAGPDACLVDRARAQGDIERLLGGQATAATEIARYVPGWYRLGGPSAGQASGAPSADAATAQDDAAAMFAGIEAIGSITTRS